MRARFRALAHSRRAPSPSPPSLLPSPLSLSLSLSLHLAGTDSATPSASTTPSPTPTPSQSASPSTPATPSASPSASPLLANELPLLADVFYAAAVPPAQRAAEPATSGRLVSKSGAPGTSNVAGVVFRTGNMPCVLTHAVVPLHFGPSYASSSRAYEARLFALAGAGAVRPDATSLDSASDGALVLSLEGTDATFVHNPATGFAGFANYSFEAAPGSDAAARTLAPRAWYALGFSCARGCFDSGDSPTTYGEDGGRGRGRGGAWPRGAARNRASARARARTCATPQLLTAGIPCPALPRPSLPCPALPRLASHRISAPRLADAQPSGTFRVVTWA